MMFPFTKKFITISVLMQSKLQVVRFFYFVSFASIINNGQYLLSRAVILLTSSQIIHLSNP